jgi:hypothetical protein
LVGVSSAVLGAAGAVVDGCGATDVDGAGPVEELSGHASTTIGTTTAAATTAASAILACLVRYQGSGGARNVSVLVSDARSCPFTVHVLTVGVETLRIGGGAGARSTRGGS